METDAAKGEEVTADFQVLLDTVRRCTDIAEHTPTILNEFIQHIRIEVHMSNKSSGKCNQQIDIYHNAVGVIDIPTGEEWKALKPNTQHR